MTGPYERLVALARLERDLALDGRVDDLSELVAQRDDLVAGLPPVPPRAAEPLLRRAAELQAETTAVLTGALAHAGAQLRGIGRDRRGARGYASAAGAAAHAVDRAG
jgi:hypothetical protein